MPDLDPLLPIYGPRLRLRLVEPDDAEYILGLRTDPAYNAHLSPVSGTKDDQRRWIEAYKAREAEGREFYLVAERRDSGRCGLIRIYSIDGRTFRWGSWIMASNRPQKGALECAVMSFEVAFLRLGLEKARVDVRRENTRAVRFYRRIGMTELHRDDASFHFTYTQAQFEAARPALYAVLHVDAEGTGATGPMS